MVGLPHSHCEGWPHSSVRCPYCPLLRGSRFPCTPCLKGACPACFSIQLPVAHMSLARRQEFGAPRLGDADSQETAASHPGTSPRPESAGVPHPKPAGLDLPPPPQRGQHDPVHLSPLFAIRCPHHSARCEVIPPLGGVTTSHAKTRITWAKFPQQAQHRNSTSQWSVGAPACTAHGDSTSPGPTEQSQPLPPRCPPRGLHRVSLLGPVVAAAPVATTGLSPCPGTSLSLQLPEPEEGQ